MNKIFLAVIPVNHTFFNKHNFKSQAPGSKVCFQHGKRRYFAGYTRKPFGINRFLASFKFNNSRGFGNFRPARNRNNASFEFNFKIINHKYKKLIATKVMSKILLFFSLNAFFCLLGNVLRCHFVGFFKIRHLSNLAENVFNSNKLNRSRDAFGKEPQQLQNQARLLRCDFQPQELRRFSKLSL